MQAHLLQTVSTAVALGLLLCFSCVLLCLCGSTDPIGFLRLIGIRLMSLQPSCPHRFRPQTRGRSGALLLGNDVSGYGLARSGSFATFLACRAMHIIGSFYVIRK